MVRISEIADRLDGKLVELECNPVIVNEHEAVVVDALLTLVSS
jgi:cell division protein ZapA (FtsZ GTPase activity inhibitor)